MQPAPKTAILAPGFRNARLVRVFPHGWNAAAVKYRPAAVAGSFSQLASLAAGKVAITHAAICLCWEVDDLLTTAQREFLWSAFEVPVFQQLLGPANNLLAYECEAHAGLHAAPEYGGPRTTPLACACGNGSTRLLDLAPPAKAQAAICGL